MTPDAVTVLVVGSGAATLWWLGFRAALPVAVTAVLLLAVAVLWRLVGARHCTLELTVTPGRVQRGDEVEVRAAARPTSRGSGRIRAAAVVLGAERDLTIPVTTGDPARWRVVAEHRGVVPSAVIRSEHVGPFRLARLRQRSRPATGTVVLPRRHPFATANLAARVDDQDRTGRTRGGAALAGLREYVPGDDVRLVHWPASAGTPDGTLLVRQQLTARCPAFRVLLDPDAADAHFESCVDVAYSLMLALATVDAHRTELCTVMNDVVARRDAPAAVERLLLEVRRCRGHGSAPGRCRAALHRIAARSRVDRTTTVLVTTAAPTASTGATVHLRLGAPERIGRFGATVVLAAPDAATAARIWATTVIR
ncbi:DUF58 domain-containing protein [Virgisporangium aurantiacum]|uniref:DUF58 domain-containing protein n=1 Tax=Virgisporangium aurantiacum TaxID=175570 RepID=A0A8J3ZME3_9ACTN|nr:DUF58 domain-containing protein [Virgisporangium aurantiacum]GIJ64238.1 hypothetical protein Vau01_117540 [Virgisporangium aurantiacum]